MLAVSDYNYFQPAVEIEGSALARREGIEITGKGSNLMTK
jgi:hypothetical protein